MTTAIVVGATGLVGRAIVDELIEDESVTTVFTLSRTSTGNYHSKVRHVFLNLQAAAQDMSAQLAEIEAEYIYFCAYTSSPNPKRMYSDNVALLENFLTALVSTGAISKVKRFILTCGLKQYGVHLGQAKQPMEESDPKLTNGFGKIDWPENFYYQQQRLLTEMAFKHGFEWVCTLPKDVIGFARGNFMNQATALGLYCAVSKVLDGSSLPFPGNRDNFFSFNSWTSADLHARFCLWAAKAPGAGNNIFNVLNGDVDSWQNIWPKLASRFGCSVPNATFAAKSNGTESSTRQLSSLQPLAGVAAELGILSDEFVTDPATIDVHIDLEEWSRREDVKNAWILLRDRYGLDQSAWEKATWDFMNMSFGRHYSTVASMSKARKLGWTGYEDTWEAFARTFDNLENEFILPPL